jgi:hypothetical protein
VNRTAFEILLQQKDGRPIGCGRIVLDHDGSRNADEKFDGE